MKKKYWFLMGLVILVVAIAAPAAFGAITGGEKVPEQQSQLPSDQMFEWHQQWLDQAQKDGQLTPEQAKTWQEHFNEMREFHNKNGLGPMNGMMGGMMNSMPGGSNGNHCSGGSTAERDITQI